MSPSTCAPAPALVVVQPQWPVSELFLDDSVLLLEVVESVTLLLTQPAGDGNQQEAERIEGPTH